MTKMKKSEITYMQFEYGNTSKAFYPLKEHKLYFMSRSILFPIPFVPQKLRFGGHNFI